MSPRSSSAARTAAAISIRHLERRRHVASRLRASRPDRLQCRRLEPRERRHCGRLLGIHRGEGSFADWPMTVARRAHLLDRADADASAASLGAPRVRPALRLPSRPPPPPAPPRAPPQLVPPRRAAPRAFSASMASVLPLRSARSVPRSLKDSRLSARPPCARAAPPFVESASRVADMLLVIAVTASATTASFSATTGDELDFMAARNGSASVERRPRHRPPSTLPIHLFARLAVASFALGSRSKHRPAGSRPPSPRPTLVPHPVAHTSLPSVWARRRHLERRPTFSSSKAPSGRHSSCGVLIGGRRHRLAEMLLLDVRRLQGVRRIQGLLCDCARTLGHLDPRHAMVSACACRRRDGNVFLIVRRRESDLALQPLPL